MRHLSRLSAEHARPVRHRRTGATLIELLVVMSLIGLLMATLVPSIKRSVELGASTICRNNLREIGTSILMYRIENDGWLPSAELIVDEQDGSTRRGPWFGKLFPTYLSDPRILECPEDPYGYRVRSADLSFDDPSVSEYASYGANSFVMTIVNGGALDPDRLRPARPHGTILAADMGPDTVDREVSQTVVGPMRNSSMLPWDDGYDPYQSTRRTTPWVTTRHDGGIHMLTIAGGVRDVNTSQVIKSPIKEFYDRCASGGCTFCNRYQVSHYSFASDQLYWWTGPSPIE